MRDGNARPPRHSRQAASYAETWHTRQNPCRWYHGRPKSASSTWAQTPLAAPKSAEGVFNHSTTLLQQCSVWLFILFRWFWKMRCKWPYNCFLIVCSNQHTTFWCSSINFFGVFLISKSCDHTILLIQLQLLFYFILFYRW